MAKVIDVRNAGGELVVLGGALILPTSAQTVTNPLSGSLRYNSTNNLPEYFSNAGSWVSVGVGGGGGVTSVATGTGLTGGPISTTGTISLANTAVTPGTYSFSTVVVDQQGRITSASSGGAGGGATNLTFSGTQTLTAASGGNVCWRSDQSFSVSGVGSRLHLAATVQRTTGGTNPFIGIVNGSGTGYMFQWQSGNGITLFCTTSNGAGFPGIGATGFSAQANSWSGSYYFTFHLVIVCTSTSINNVYGWVEGTDTGGAGSPWAPVTQQFDGTINILGGGPYYAAISKDAASTTSVIGQCAMVSGALP